MEAGRPLGTDDLERGRDAFGRRMWADAFKALTRADETTPLVGDDIRSMAWSAYLIGRHDDFVRAMERDHHAEVEVGNDLGAARTAIDLGFVLGHRGEIGPATGWFARADRLVERDGSDCVERGYLRLPVMLQHALSSAWEDLHAAASEAARIGVRFAEADLTAFSLHWQGRALMRLGRVDEGQRLLDESMVAVTAGEVSPMFTGVIYCSIIEAFQEVFALGRSQEWTAALSRWCDGQPDLVPFSGQCLVHRSELMVLHGAWDDAIDEARRATARTAGDPNPFVRAAALYQEGDVHRLRGDFFAAEAAYRDASELGWDPQPGLALLKLAEGDARSAAAAIRRRVGETVGDLERARLLPALVVIELALGDASAAAAGCAELGDTASRYATPVLGAMAACAAGAVALAGGDATSALGQLRDAQRVWQHLEAPYEVARSREQVGLACRALNDHATADLELDAARRGFERLGAAPDISRLDALAQPRTTRGAVGLTEREHQVLRLVATGLTNKAVAAELFVSDKTVDRHVSNILAKLGVSTRAAATAYAYEHQLI